MPNSAPATMPAASVPSRRLSDTPRQRAHSATMANAPIERTVAWMSGGISGSASFTETWFRPHENVTPIMISAATASSGREVLDSRIALRVIPGPDPGLEPERSMSTAARSWTSL